MGRIRHHQNDSYPLVPPPTGGAATRYCPSLIIPQTRKKRKKRKKRPTQPGLAKGANKQRKMVASDVQSPGFNPQPLTSTPNTGSVGAQRAHNSLPPEGPPGHSQIGAYRPQASRGATAERLPVVEKLRFGQAAPLESPCTKETASKTKGNWESSPRKRNSFL
jgi:hypothetical protein